MPVKKIDILKDGYISHYFRSGNTYTWYCEPFYVGSADKLRLLVNVLGIGPNEKIVSKYLVGNFTTSVTFDIQGSPSKDINTIWTSLTAPTSTPDTTIEEDGVVVEYVREEPNIMPWIRIAITLTRNGYNNSIPCGFGEFSASIIALVEEN